MHATTENITATIVGGMIGGLVALGLIIGFTIPLMILFSRRQGMQLSFFLSMLSDAKCIQL